MNVGLFIKLSSNYFGEYRPAVMAEVAATLKEWDEQSIADLWDEMKSTKETSYKTPPDVFDIVHSDAEKARKVRARQARIDNKTRLLMAPDAEPSEEIVEDFHEKVISIFRGQA